MKNSKLSRYLKAYLILAITMLVLVPAFQNCGGGFQYGTKDDGATGLGSNQSALDVLNSQGAKVSQLQSLAVGPEYSIAIAEAYVPLLTSVTWTLTSVPSTAAHFVDTTEMKDRTFHCEAPAQFSISIVANLSDGRQMEATLDLKCVAGAATPTPTPPTGGADIVVFRIPAGTNNQPWNTLGTAVRVFVGQTLRIINDDTVNHRLHTGGSPCPHQPASSPPGGFYDCVIASAVNAAAGSLYDHNFGNNAKFYVNAYNGGQLYANNCASCHGPLATSTKRNDTAAAIRSAIMTVPQMQGLNLTDDQLAAIAYSLSR